MNEHYRGRLKTIEEELAVREASRKELEEEKSDLYSQLKEVRSRLKDEEEKLNTAQENIRSLYPGCGGRQE